MVSCLYVTFCKKLIEGWNLKLWSTHIVLRIFLTEPKIFDFPFHSTIAGTEILQFINSKTCYYFKFINYELLFIKNDLLFR